MASVTYPGIVSGLVSFGATVTGIRGSYGGTTLRDRISEAVLPCLIVLPDQGTIERFGMNGANGRLKGNLVHALLYWPLNKVRKSLPETLPALDTLHWNYAQALGSLPFLTALTAPSIHQPATPQYKFGPIMWDGEEYDGILYTYDYEIYY